MLEMTRRLAFSTASCSFAAVADDLSKTLLRRPCFAGPCLLAGRPSSDVWWGWGVVTRDWLRTGRSSNESWQQHVLGVTVHSDDSSASCWQLPCVTRFGRPRHCDSSCRYSKSSSSDLSGRQRQRATSQTLPDRLQFRL